jgi:hypothetical protein
MIATKHLLVLLLAVRKCSITAPLSLIQKDTETIFYFGIVKYPKVIFWYNSRIDINNQPLKITSEYTMFTLIIRETISCLNWFLDNLKKTSREIFGTGLLNINVVNSDRSVCTGTYFTNFI